MGHDGASGCERFDRADRRPLVARRQDERIERRVEGGNLFLVAEEENLAHDPELVCPALELRPVRPVTDHAEHRVDAAVAQPLERNEYVVRPLYRRHAADPTDGEPAVRDAEVAAALGTTIVELDAQADHDEALGRRNAETDQIVTHLRAHGDQCRRAGGEPALEQTEEQRANRAEVTAEDVAVERVDDDRGSPGAGKPRGNSPDRSGLCRVRVQDLRALLSDQPRQPDRRGEIPDRRDLAAELVDVDDLHAVRVGDEGHRVLAARERAGDECRLIATLPQALGEIGDVQRRPAHVQPGDDAQDLYRLLRPRQRWPRP